MSKLLKAISVVFVVWLLLFLVQESFLSWLPGMLSFDLRDIGLARAQREEVLSHDGESLSGIRVETHNGSVVLHGTEQENVEVRARYVCQSSYHGRAEELVRSFSTDLSVNNGQLLVKANFGEQRNGNQSASYEIFLPKHLAVDIETSNGAVEIENMSSDAVIATSNAKVTLTSGFRMGKLDVDTSNAQVKVSVPAGIPELKVKTSNGRIEVDGCPESGRWELRTSNAGVSVSLPQTLGIRLDAVTSNGSIDVGEGPWSINDGRLSGKELNATRGDGALELLVHTSNGSIEIVER